MRVGMILWGATAGRGGTERFGCTLANMLVERGHEAMIFYNDYMDSDLQYPVNGAVVSANLRIDAEADITHAGKVILGANLDVLLLCSSAWITLCFVRILHNSGIPLVYSERNSPYAVSHHYWNPLEHSACLLAMDHIVLIQESFRKEFPDYVQDRISFIPNMKAIPTERAKPEGEMGKQKILLSVGRCVDSSKQFSMLFTAFSDLVKYFPDWRLRHCGVGEDFNAYKHLVKKLNCEDSIELVGLIEDMDVEYTSAHLLCLPSKFEGCSNTLLEAHACGLPTVGFAAAPGVNEQIIHGKNGLLVKDMNAEALAESLAALMSAPLKRKEMGLQARLGAINFTPEILADQWEALLLQTAKRKGHTRLNIPFPEDKTARQRIQAEAALRNVLLRRHLLKPFSM